MISPFSEWYDPQSFSMETPLCYNQYLVRETGSESEPARES